MTTLVQALQFTVEDLQEKSIEELQELHSILSGSKQKKARLQADLVAGIMSAKMSAKRKEKVTTTVEKTVENSMKPKRKATVKKKKAEAKTEEKAEAKADAQAQADAPVEAPAQADEKTGEKTGEKVQADTQAQKKKKATPKKANAGEKALEEMSKEELLAYVKQLQEQKEREIFPEVIEGEKVRFKQVKLETIQDIQKLLLERPYQLYLFADEGLNDLTQFIVLFANDEVIVLLDRNQQRNSTVTIKTEQLKENYIIFEKEGKFAYRFYIREAKQEEEEKQEEKSE